MDVRCYNEILLTSLILCLASQVAILMRVHCAFGLIFLHLCCVFAWQGFGSGRAVCVASVRSCEKLPPCLIKASARWL